MCKRGKAPRRGKLAAALEQTAHDPRRRAVAASVLAAGGAIATGKLVRDRVIERRRRKRMRRYRLEPGESPRDGIGRIARGQLELAIGLLEDGESRGHDEAIHEARKALKRLRAALRVSRGFLGDERYRHENRVLRDAGRSLSGPRDAQVLLETLDQLAERHAEELAGSEWAGLRHALKSSAETGGDRAAAATVVGSLADVRGRVATWPLPQEGGPEALAPGLARIYRRGRRALRHRRARADHGEPARAAQARQGSVVRRAAAAPGSAAANEAARPARASPVGPARRGPRSGGAAGARPSSARAAPARRARGR